MADPLDLLYLGSLAVVGLVSFWDAPYRVYRAYRRGTVQEDQRYHLLNLASVVLLGGWLGLLLATGFDVAWMPLTEGGQAIARMTGVVLTWVGLSYALWARLVLQESFTPTLAVSHDHRVATQGPYAQVRHPFYLGMGSALVGGILALDSLLTLAVVALVLPIIRELAVLEEEHLARVLGRAYSGYARHVPRFIPGMAAPAVGRG